MLFTHRLGLICCWFFRSVEEEIRPRFPCPYCFADFKELTYSFLENSHSS
ncbi:hypothetical protein HanIR_Chr08g0358851 [Helianthus annuus]|nr:hypothetical protein HanIR_Chr08g0358851 [Helianthus annuus]